jgi:branched-chain amino acid aminotransferase
MIVSIDGELVEPERATISVLDRGLLYGDGVFEVLRTWSRRAPDLAAHVARLRDAAARLTLRVPAAAVLSARVKEVVAAADDGDLRVRIVVTRGVGPVGARLAALGPGRTIVIADPLPPQPTELSAAIVDWPLPARRGPAIKALAYLDHVIARELAAAAGTDEAIRLDAAGHVAECATANLFVARGGAVATPPLDGVLPGIVRGHAIALCGRLGIACAERAIAIGELADADEVFATSSLRGILAVTRVDGRTISRGPIAARLAAAYLADRR